jgi:hypothetical protein
VVYSYDVATQAMRGPHLEVADGRGEYSTIPFRYVWPAELDLMARLAGLRLRERWDGWTDRPSPARAASTSRSGSSPPAPPPPGVGDAHIIT